MKFSRTLLLSYAILAVQLPITDAGNLSEMVNKVHKAARKHTRSLATDIRTAFGGVLVADQAQSPLQDSSRAVYCKANQGLLGGGGGDGDNDDGGDDGSDSGGSGNSTTSSSPSSTSNSNSGTASATSTSSGSSSSSTPTGISTPWKLVKEHSGDTFFDGWDFWTYDDPTHGNVDYISESDGRSDGLVEVNSNGQAIMRVDTTQQISGNRKSIRIHTKDSYNGFLMLMDSEHMPTGCATWPAFWTNGPNWPNGGEIDIIEGIHDNTNNQVALHTTTGCSASTDFSKTDGYQVHADSCAVDQGGDNLGCGIRSNNAESFGAAFNKIGGGVYATRWDDNGIFVWFFPRNEIPDDIKAGTPQPKNWPNPDAGFPSGSCDPYKYFYDNLAIFDTTLCGDWAGTSWESTGSPGQETSCKDRTGFNTCLDFVRNSGSSFQEAYWVVNYVKVFQTSSQN